MRIAYITAKLPFGTQETFILTEILALKQLGLDIIVIPRDKGKHIFHKQAESLIKDTINIPWFNRAIVLNLLLFIIMRPHLFFKLLYLTVFKVSPKIGLKNLIIFPKSIYLSKIFTEKSISHIHAHWASTTATMAYIISMLTDIPWSFTAHRWDIKENNLISKKCKTSTFVRVISKKGKKDLIQYLDNDSLCKKIYTIHMGVIIPVLNTTISNRPDYFTFICPANLLPVKGHKYLFEACRILSEKNIKFKCLIAGDGPLEKELRDLVMTLGLKEFVEFLGRLPHNELLNLYSAGKIDTLVLPSIITSDGEKEGVPVALMEAMSYGIPVISTDTGGIAELIDNNCGILVEEKNPRAIAVALEKLIKNPSLRETLGKKGKEKIHGHFNASNISQELIKLFSKHSYRQNINNV